MIEFFEEDKFIPCNSEVTTYRFTFENPLTGIEEHHIAVVHFSTTIVEREMLDEVLQRASQWYKEYMIWEDSGIASEDYTIQN